MTLEVIHQRRTCRSFIPDYEIPANILNQLIEAGLTSPTARNLQGIDLLVLTNKSKIGTVSQDLLKTWPKDLLDGRKEEVASHKVKDVLTCDAPAIFFLYKNERAQEHLLQVDAGIYTQTICLAAKALGLETMILGLILFGDKSVVEKDIGIPVGSLLIAIAVGKARPDWTPGSKKILWKARIE